MQIRHKTPAFQSGLMSGPRLRGGLAHLSASSHPIPLQFRSAFGGIYTWLESCILSLFHLIGHWVFLPSVVMEHFFQVPYKVIFISLTFSVSPGRSLLPLCFPLCLLQILLLCATLLQEPLVSNIFLSAILLEQQDYQPMLPPLFLGGFSLRSSNSLKVGRNRWDATYLNPRMLVFQFLC